MVNWVSVGVVIVNCLVCVVVSLGMLSVVYSLVGFSFLCSFVFGVCLFCGVILVFSSVLSVCWFFCLVKKLVMVLVIVVFMLGSVSSSGVGVCWMMVRLLS